MADTRRQVRGCEAVQRRVPVAAAWGSRVEWGTLAHTDETSFEPLTWVRRHASMARMSFDLFAQRFENGQASDIPVPEVLDVLRPFLVVGPEEGGGFCRTRTPDGGEADFYLDDGRCGFGVNHFDRGETCELILRAAACHGLVLFGPGTPAMLTDARQLEHLPEPLLTRPPPVLVVTGPELEAVIGDDPEAYRICRERLEAAT